MNKDSITATSGGGNTDANASETVTTTHQASSRATRFAGTASNAAAILQQHQPASLEERIRQMQAQQQQVQL